MEERFEISILLDFYGNLLTEKQLDIMNMYYNEDLSLAEIAELNNTSRQAIHDILKRCQKSLVEYECKLELMKNSEDIKFLKKSLLKKIEILKSKVSDNGLKPFVDDIERDIMENL
ncbi:helix-turn-helix protein [Clostridiales bacterium oral taxon 876 str. F0540]|nr:helix-turn-helix protein [Clostridiales bacterium oral taxon 876 str. F0540]